jgi:hypothetical protein
VDYIKNHDDLDKTPFGLHAVVPAAAAHSPASSSCEKHNGGVNIGNQNASPVLYGLYHHRRGSVGATIFSKEMLDTMPCFARQN